MSAEREAARARGRATLSTLQGIADACRPLGLVPLLAVEPVPKAEGPTLDDFLRDMDLVLGRDPEPGPSSPDTPLDHAD